MAENLERLCELTTDVIVSAPSAPGLERIGARFAGAAYSMHRHDTYAIGMTLHGVQTFWYRGQVRHALAGQTLVLHPDEPHDGGAGTEAGLQYRMLCLAPSLLRDAIGASPVGLPFVATPVMNDPVLKRTLGAVLADLGRGLDELASDQLVTNLAAILGRHAAPHAMRHLRPATQQVRRAQAYLDAHLALRVGSAELEKVSGLDRFCLTRQFKLVLGTTPHRYLVMRRLQQARRRLEYGEPLAEVAIATGFADQSHLTRHFRAALGMPPGQWRRLTATVV